LDWFTWEFENYTKVRTLRLPVKIEVQKHDNRIRKSDPYLKLTPKVIKKTNNFNP
jgi:hypothetical protein